MPSGRTNRALLGIFFAVLWAPLLILVLHLDDERRALAFEMTSPAPGWPTSLRSLKEWPNTYRRYFDAHFGLRAPLMRAHASIKLGVFGVSSSERVILGNDGWLFFSMDGLVDDFRGVHPFTDEELGAWLDALRGRRDWLRARGIPYVFYLAPNPQTIYPEEMPAGLTRVGAATRAEQLMGYVESHSDVTVLDVRPALMRRKALERVYFKTDTHWNGPGAFAAYEEVARRLAGLLPRWRPDLPGDFGRVETEGFSGDLTLMLASPWYRETATAVVLRHRAIEGDATVASIERPYAELACDEGELGTAVVFRDSFFAAQSDLVGRHFRRTVLVNGPFDAAVVERERPDVVIEEKVERSLLLDVPRANLPGVPDDPVPAGPARPKRAASDTASDTASKEPSAL